MPHIHEGDEIGARFLNNHEDAYEWWRRFKARGEGGGPFAAPVNFSIVMTANYVGTQIHIGEVCEFNGSPFADVDLSEQYPDPRNNRWLKAVTPNTERVGWGIALEPIRGTSGAEREGGQFLVLGICHALVVMESEDHQYAERRSGERVLHSTAAKSAVKILHKPTGGSPRLCLVQLMDESGGTELVRFELEETLELKGHAKAKLLDETWSELDPPVAIEVYDPFQVGAGMWAGVTGYQGWAVARPESFVDEGEEGSEDDETRAAYDIVWMEQTAAIIQFTTTEYMAESTPGGLNVTINWFDHQGREIEGTVTVYHLNSQFPDVHSGAKGTAVYDYKNSFYRIVSAQRVAMFAEATLSESLCPDADPAPTSVSISSFAVQPCGDYVGSPPTIPTVANIGTIHAGMNGDKVKLRRISNTLPNPTWEIIAISKHLIEPVVNVELTETALKQWKRKVWVEACDTTETESTIDTVSDCEEA